MPILQDGSWEPELTDKQREAYYNNARVTLLSGPRYSGKTVGAIKRIIRHAWEIGNDTQGACIGVYCTTIKAGLGGIWKGIYTLLQEWVNAGVEGENGVVFSMVNGTNHLSSRGATRQYYMQIYNQFGAISEFQLHSLEFEGDVEKKFFSTEFTALFFSELQNFHDVRTFRVPMLQLRSMSNHIPYEKFMWIADTNPPDEGEQHWAHQIFFVNPNLTEPPETCETEEDRKSFDEYRKSTKLIEFTIHDNPKADPRVISELKNMYRDDPEGWARFVEGKWVKGIGFKGAWFAKDFIQRKSQIVIGSLNHSKDPEDWEVMLPDKQSNILYIGLDTGETNHAGVILQKRFVNGASTWDILDEIVYIRTELMLSEFGEELLSKMMRYEKYLNRAVDWTCWADTSLERFKPNSVEGSDATIIMNACENKFFIQFATDAKKPKTVRRRITMMTNLLRQGRIFVSANCVKTIKMFEGLRKGATEFQHIMKGDDNKHVFDAITYPIFQEMLDDNELNEATPEAVKYGGYSPIITAKL